jgi:hypothetical protein
MHVRYANRVDDTVARLDVIGADADAWISGITLLTSIGVIVDDDETAALTTSKKNNFDLI